LIFGTPPFAVGATTTSGLTVSFNSQTKAVCAVSGNACTIQATQAGNANHAAATPVDQSFQVTPASRGNSASV
jgi:hypothetical protein